MRLDKLVVCLIMVFLATLSHGAGEDRRPVVGILSGALNRGSQGLARTMENWDELRVVSLPELSEDALNGVDVLCVSHVYPYEHRSLLREFVMQSGKGLLLTHDAAGSGRRVFSESSGGTFPELVHTPEKTEGGVETIRALQVIREHPITGGLPRNFQSSYKNHAVLFPVHDQQVLLEDSPISYQWSHRTFHGTQQRWNRYVGGNAVLVAGPVGKGRVVLYGALPGVDTSGKEAAVEGAENRLLKNILGYLLAGNQESERPMKRKTSKYRPQQDIILPELDRAGVTMPERALESQSSERTRTSVPVTLELPEAGRPVLASFKVEASWGHPVALVVEGRAMPIVYEADGRGTVLITPKARRVQGQLSYDPMVATDMAVTLTADGSAALIQTHDLRLIVGAEQGRGTIQSLQVRDWAYHHTWQGLECNQYSAPVLRLSESMWPFWKRPFDYRHEQAYPESVFEATTCRRFAQSVELAVGEGKLKVYGNGQMKMERFASAGRLATWCVDCYQQGERTWEENGAHDLPVLKGKILLVKKSRYALGGDLTMDGKLGVTGMSPGVMRQMTMNGKVLFATTDVERASAYFQLPEVVVAELRVKEDSGDQLKTVRLPEQSMFFSKLWRRRGTERWFPMLPKPLEIAEELVPGDVRASIATWCCKGLILHQGIADAGRHELADDKVIGQDETGVYRRFFLSNEDFEIGRYTACLQGLDEEGRCRVEIPIRYGNYVSIPVGMFTYDSYWTERRQDEIPASEYPKIMRSLAMSGVDYVIHCAQQTKPVEGTDQVLRRLIRYGLRYVPDVSGFHARYCKYTSAKFRSYDKLKFDAGVDEKLSAVFRKFKDHPSVLAWYLTDEVAFGKVTKPEQLTVGYQITNHMYEVADRVLNPGDIKCNLITTYFTDASSWINYLKTDVFSYDPYYNYWKALENDVRKHSRLCRTKDPDKPLWATIRSCGPTWYDCRDLYLDIRRQAIAAWLQGCDSINFFMFAHWRQDMEKNAWYMVTPGPRGPVGTPRRQFLDYITEDLRLLTTAEYLVGQKPELAEEVQTAKKAARDGRFFEMRAILERLLKTGK